MCGQLLVAPAIVLWARADWRSFDRGEYALVRGDGNARTTRLNGLRNEYMAKAGSPSLQQDIDAEIGAYFVLARKRTDG